MNNDPTAPVSGSQSAPQKTGRARMKPMPPWLALLCKIAVLALLLFLTLTFVMGVHIQEGNRMYPFLMDGDLLITYKLEEYRVGDVVAYRHPETGNTEISRIVAMGDNVIQVTEYGELLINGSSPSERVFYPTAPLEGENVEYPYTMRRGGYFVLDDYRSEGDDSRRFGQLLQDDLLGKVVYVFRRRGI